MTLLQAFVWCFGILVGGSTICSVAKSLSGANKIVEEIRFGLRKVYESTDELRHEMQMSQEEQHGSENHFPNGPEDDRR